ncbi:MAG TPA: phospho-sugar mutase [Rhabdochlamydiaceae bacterium]|jgi:phosphoglucomutase/phosphomannomutase
MSLPPDVKKRIDQWLSGPYDEQTKKEIRELLSRDPQSLIDAFYSDLAFGTGGMRGLMGVGTNRLNIYTIQMATQGLAHYLIKQKPSTSLSIVIGFDSRHHSEEFADCAARVLAGNGIAVYLLSELRPTPFVSFACRYKKADAAIMITASHNPKEYNGYKVYWSDGAQVVHPHDIGIVKEANAIKTLQQIKLSAPDAPLIKRLRHELDQPYLDAIRPLQHFVEENKKKGALLKIVYTPLHGTGITMTPKALADWGFTSVECVKAQSTPDGDFPTVSFPNPEYPEALKLGMELLAKNQADILIANDPDADRMGIVALHQGKLVILNGNEVASICVDFLCRVLMQQKKMPERGAFVTTIVSTELLKEIANAYHKTCFEVLTGFKYIGEKIHQWEISSPSFQFLFGAEESYGYLIGTHARDKDAIVCSCLLAEIALEAKRNGLTLVDLLNQIYETYGVFREKQASLNFKPDKEGIEKMKSIMDHLRQHPPSTIADSRILYCEDYLSGIRQHFDTQQKEKLTLPQSDVLLFRLADKSRIVIRPSGTEPKIKIYASACLPPTRAIASATAQCDQKLDQLLASSKALLS